MVTRVTPTTKPLQDLYSIELHFLRWLLLCELHFGGLQKVAVSLENALDPSKVLVCVTFLLLVSSTGWRRGEE